MVHSHEQWGFSGAKAFICPDSLSTTPTLEKWQHGKENQAFHVGHSDESPTTCYIRLFSRFTRRRPTCKRPTADAKTTVPDKPPGVLIQQSPRLLSSFLHTACHVINLYTVQSIHPKDCHGTHGVCMSLTSQEVPSNFLENRCIRILGVR